MRWPVEVALVVAGAAIVIVAIVYKNATALLIGAMCIVLGAC